MTIQMRVVVVLAGLCAGLASVAGQTAAPRIASVFPTRVTAGESFHVTVQVPPKFEGTLQLAVRRMSHQGAAKYAVPLVDNDDADGDVKKGLIDHVVHTDEGWLNIESTFTERRKNAATEEYAIGLDSFPLRAMDVVTVTGGAEWVAQGRAIKVIDGNIDTLKEAVEGWTAMRAGKNTRQFMNVPPTGDGQKSTGIHVAYASKEGGGPDKFIYYVGKESNDYSAVLKAQQNSLLKSTQDLEAAIDKLPAGTGADRRVKVNEFKEHLAMSVDLPGGSGRGDGAPRPAK